MTDACKPWPLKIDDETLENAFCDRRDAELAVRDWNAWRAADGEYKADLTVYQLPNGDYLVASESEVGR